MIIFPTNQEQWAALAEFLRDRAHVAASADMQMCAWVDQKNMALKMVVALNGFMGRVCQIHVAMEEDFHFTPKEMLAQVFNHAFNTCGRDMLLGIVNSNNLAAMKYDLNLGFEEAYRLKGMHDDGGDIVILQMTRENCRYLADSPQKELLHVH